MSWGIPVPDDEDHVMYVWLDALTNYITAVGYPDTGTKSFKDFWPADYHVIGKDIVRFHAVYWPAFLMSAGIDLPKTIFAHGFINVQGVKMSKSLGNVLSPDGLVKIYGLDAIRYLLMREIPHGQDGNFSHDHAIQRINADLANGLGNLAQRTLSMIYKNCDARIPAVDVSDFTAEDKALLEKTYTDLQGAMRNHFRTFEFHKGLEVTMTIARAADAYIDAQAPWKLKKDDPVRMAVVLYTLAEVIRALAIAMLPVTPEAANKILDQLEIEASQRYLAHIDAKSALKGGTAIEKPEGVFPRIVEQEEEQKKAAS